MLYIHLFGHLRLFDQERIYTTHIPHRILSLWAYLLLNRGKTIQRDRLAGLLYTNMDNRQALARLRRSLHELQQALPPEKHGRPWLLQDPNTIQWNPETDYWLDVAEFEHLSASADHLPKSVVLYTGDLLIGIYENWLVAERERLHSQYLTNLRKLSATSIAAYDYPQAALYLQQILAHEPLSEDALAELIQLRYLVGNRAGALQLYRRFERLLKKELGVTPMPETQALYETIYRNEPLTLRPSSLTRDVVTPMRPERPTNLPRALNSFLGRDQELLDLQHLLTTFDPVQRLVTITGLAGCGKTRLALEAANQLLTNANNPFPDGVFFVDIAAIHQAEEVLVAIAQAIHPRQYETDQLHNVLTMFLSHRHLLLLLDNFEQVVEAGGLLVELLAAAPNLHILITSRISLRVYGEYEYALHPLPLPGPEQIPSTTNLKENPAVALFTARAAEHNAHITLTDENTAIIAEICTHLDGLPLAIELAANRARLYSPTAILTHLKDRLNFLTGGARNLPVRQQALRNAIEWSYNLLNEAEKTFFVALGVFAGDWTPLAAQQVCGSFTEGDMLAALDTLASHNLISLRGHAETPRFSMVSILREYALERLQEQGLRETLRQRHASYYAQLAEDTFDIQHNPEEAWVQYFQDETANLQAALSWSLALPMVAEHIEIGVRLSTRLMTFWSVTNQMRLGRAWYEQQLPYRYLLPVRLQVTLLAAAGNFAQHLGDFSQSENLLHEAIELAQRAAEPTWESTALRYLGTCARRQGNLTQACALLTQSIALEQASYEKAMNSSIAAAYNNLAIVLTEMEKYAEASSLLRDTLNYHKAQNNERRLGTTLLNLGGLALKQNQEEEAETFLRQSLEIRLKFGDPYGIALCLSGMADLAIQRKQAVRGARLFGFHEVSSQISYQERGRTLTADNLNANQHQIDTLRTVLGERDFAAAWAEGQSMTIEQAVAYALETSTPAEGQNRAQGNTPEFPPERLDDDAAARWLEAWWHPQGLKCPDCGNTQTHPFRTARKNGLAVYRCRQCRKTYTLYSNTPLQGSHLRPSEVVRLLRRIDEGENITGLAHSLGISWRTAQKLSQALKMGR